MKLKNIVLNMLVIGLSVCLFCSPTTVNAQTIKNVSENYTDYDTYNNLNDFTVKNPQRAAGTVGEKNAGAYIADYFTNLGLGVTQQEFVVYFDYNTEKNVTSHNIIATKSANGNQKTVIIGAHMDNIAISGGSGAVDNGSGIAALLTLAQKLNDKVLPYNIVYVAFGSEETGLFGSKHFVEKMTQSEKDNTLVFINLDTICTGEYIYVYGEDITTNFQRFFVDNSIKQGNTIIKNMPNNKRITTLIYGYGHTGVSFYHTGQASDNSSFKNAMIPTVFFFSGNLESDLAGYVENKDYTKAVMHSSKDNINTLKNIYGMDFVLKMESVVDSLVNTLTNEQFVNTMADGRKELIPSFLYNGVYSSLIVIAIVAILGIFLWNYFKKLEKKSYLNTSDFNEKKNIFTKPKDDDIFTFRK